LAWCTWAKNKAAAAFGFVQAAAFEHQALLGLGFGGLTADYTDKCAH